MALDARKLAEHFTEGAKQNYTRDRYLAPIIAFVREDGAGLIIQPRAGHVPDHPPSAFAAITEMLGKVSQARFIAMVSEAWHRAMPGPDYLRAGAKAGFMAGFAQGDLEKLRQAGDREVRTALQVTVLDLVDHSQHVGISTVVLNEDDKDHPPEYDEPMGADAGPPAGNMVDMPLAAYEMATEAIGGVPPLEVLGLLLEMAEWCRQCIVAGPGAITAPL